MEGAGGQQHSIAGRLLGKRLEAAGSAGWEARLPSSAGYRGVFDRDSAPVAWGLGRDLGAIALLFSAAG
jgi:hypothetical protein